MTDFEKTLTTKQLNVLRTQQSRLRSRLGIAHVKAPKRGIVNISRLKRLNGGVMHSYIEQIYKDIKDSYEIFKELHDDCVFAVTFRRKNNKEESVLIMFKRSVIKTKEPIVMMSSKFLDEVFIGYFIKIAKSLGIPDSWTDC